MNITNVCCARSWQAKVVMMKETSQKTSIGCVFEAILKNMKTIAFARVSVRINENKQHVIVQTIWTTRGQSDQCNSQNGAHVQSERHNAQSLYRHKQARPLDLDGELENQKDEREEGYVHQNHKGFWC